MNRKPIMLMILDGFGINENEKGNAVKLANTPNIDKLMKKYPNTDIFTSGLHVGLPEGQMGNSEVGHTNIGAGRVVYQDLTRITKSIEDGEFFSIKELTAAIDNCKKYNSKLHIMGILLFIRYCHMQSSIYESKKRFYRSNGNEGICIWTA